MKKRKLRHTSATHVPLKVTSAFYNLIDISNFSVIFIQIEATFS